MGKGRATTIKECSTSDENESLLSMEEQGQISSEFTMLEYKHEKFVPYDQSQAQAPAIPCGLPPDVWTIIQAAPAGFSPQCFLQVSRNIVENPNLTAPHIARAEISYQSFTDATFNHEAKTSEELASIIKHLRPECRPRLLSEGIEGYKLEWTVVRKLIPRNPNLDDSLMQTCHLFTSQHDIMIISSDGRQENVKAERYMVIYIPHSTSPDAVPYYHPKVQSLAMLYTYFPEHDATASPLPSPGQLSLYYNLFPAHPLDNRLARTALMLLQIIHKHSRGRQAGYTKRVHHDQIIPQKAFGDTYAYMKGKYAKDLIEGWVEQTPPEKHVFEDLGIAAFLIELWTEMYAPAATKDEYTDEPDDQDRRKRAQAAFPGFVDIGCGNGLLVYLLVSEGWSGWGFDARRRKTWDKLSFSSHSTTSSSDAYLKELLLVPSVLQPDPSEPICNAPPPHNGIFPNGTFIISNHADELTPWTPLLAYLSSSPFIAIPCCSHDFGGTRFRAPVYKEYFNGDHFSTTLIEGKQPSAYASLCSWVSRLTEAVGYQAEKEHLRIPSTRNTALVGRKQISVNDNNAQQFQEKMAYARDLVEKEMGGKTTIEQVWRMWMRSGSDLVKKTNKNGH
ncbi:tRNA(Ser) Um(44) 2'-O-methyltransferase [Coniothyrium glycines]